jgi:hypothetical protein
MASVGAQIFSVLLLASFSMQYCIMGGGNCTGGDPGCIPNIYDINNASQTTPTQWQFPPELQGYCPDFENQPNCCSYFTMVTLAHNLDLIDMTFGNPTSGCSICAMNLKRFWCQYNCSPNQSNFIIPGSSFAFNYTVDPSNPDTTQLVVTSNITLDIATTCGIFQSCQSVDFTKSLGSMSTYQGLFNTFSSEAVTQGNVLMNFTYVSNSTALVSGFNNCTYSFNGTTDNFNYTIPLPGTGLGYCNCQHCSSNCTDVIDFSLYIKQHGVLDGFHTDTIVKAAVASGITLVVGLVLRLLVFNRDDGSSFF